RNASSDAALIAECTANLGDLGEPPDPRLAALAEHLLFIEEIEFDIARLKTRREHFVDKRSLNRVDRDSKAQQRRCDAELVRLQATVRKHDDLASRLELIASVDGVGIR